MARSKHTFTIEAEFEDSEEYEAFVSAIPGLGGEIVDETSDL